MYNMYKKYPSPYYTNAPGYYPKRIQHVSQMQQYPYYSNSSRYNSSYSTPYANQYDPYTDGNRNKYEYAQTLQNNNGMEMKDNGPEPFAFNINEATRQNDTFRTAIWTGDHLQVTLMSINVGEDIGLEQHTTLDQFIRIEEGQGQVLMGDREDQMDFQEEVSDDFAFIIPAGKWHNLINTGDTPLKLYSIYAPPNHPQGTVHETKEDAIAAEEN